MRTRAAESRINTAARIKVDLNTSFSKPLLVKEEEAPQLLPKPVPLDWIIIAPIRSSETIIWKTVKNCFTGLL